MPNGRPRSSSAPRERGPKVLHKNSPQKQSPLSPSSRNSGSNNSGGGLDVNIQLPPLRRPSSATPRSDCNSQRSAHNDDCHLSRSGSFANNLGNIGAGGEKCVCFICTCGKHHCPPAYKSNTTPLDATTHYSETYKTHELGSFPERVVMSQTYVGTRAAPGHFDTTQKAHYVPPDIKAHTQNFAERMERSRPNNQRTSPREQFDHTSAHRQDYPWHNPNPAQPIRPAAESPISAGPFYGNTTTKETYVGWKADPDAYQRTSHSIRNNSHSPFSNEPADFGTSYGGHFTEHTVAPRAPPKQKASYSYGSPRSFHTSNQLDFTGKQNPICPAHMLPPRPASARTGHVKYRLDVTGTWA